MRWPFAWILLWLSSFGQLSAVTEGMIEGLRYPFFSATGHRYAEIQVRQLNQTFRKIGPLRCRLWPCWEAHQVAVEVDVDACSSEDWRALTGELRARLPRRMVRDVRWTFRRYGETVSLQAGRTWIDTAGAIQMQNVLWQDPASSRFYPRLQIVDSPATAFCILADQQTLFPAP